MVKALQRLDKPVEWMPLDDEGHGFSWVHDQVRYYNALLAFFERYLGTPREPAAAASATARTPQ